MSDLSSRLSGLSRQERARLFDQLRKKGEKAGAPRRPEPIGRRDPAAGPPPLSFSQLRLWFLDRLRPGEVAFNIPGGFRLTGPLDPAALSAAYAKVVERHESLRTTFATVDEEPVQVIADRIFIALPVVDLSGLYETTAEREFGILAEEESLQPFDLTAGSLVRARLVRHGAEHHVLILNLHHIISDGWSMGVMMREMMAFYQAFSSGAGLELPELPIQYADYAVWQRQWLQGERLETHLAYWREQLADLPEPLDLPTDHPRPPVLTSAGARHLVYWHGGLNEALKEVARQQGATLFVALLAGFQAFLHRYTGQEDLLVGTPTANRNRPEVAGVIGFFVNTLVLRGDLSGDPTFGELVGRLKDVTFRAFQHEELPFERLVEELRPERDPSRTPLFQVMLSLQNTPVGMAQTLPGEATDPQPGETLLQMLAFETGATQFELTLGLQETGGTLFGALSHNTDLFDTATAARWAGQIERLLRAAAVAPDTRISELPLLSEEERDQVLSGWSGAGSEASQEDRLHAGFEAWAAQTPDAVAVETLDGLRWTYAELEERANRLAAYLSRLGVGPEARVGLMAERSPELLAGMLAVLKAGGAYLPLDPAYPTDRLAWMLDDSGARILLTQSRLEAGRDLTESLPAGLQVIDLDTQDWLSEDGLPLPRPSAGEGWGGGSWTHPAQAAYVIYTSGSTGRPKGVVVPHSAVAPFIQTCRTYFALAPGERLLQFSSLSFDTSVEEIWVALNSGASLVFRSEAMASSAAHLLADAGRLNLAVLIFPTAYWHELVAELEPPAALPPSVRLVVIGGEAALPGRIVEWNRQVSPEVRLVNAYGPTETTVAATFSELAGRKELAQVPIGRPLSGMRAYVVGLHGEMAPPGAFGELQLGGVSVARGYLGRPDLTADRFVPDPWGGTPGARLYRTGDRVRFLPNGELTFAGRVDRQVKVRGYRIELGEIEAALSAYPGVREAVVAVRGPRLVAYFVPREEGDDPSAELRDFLRSRLPEFMVPTVFERLAALPLTGSGKIDRRALPEPSWEGTAEAYVAPRTPVESELAAIWSELLGMPVERVSADSNFFDLGGHSLLAARCLARVRQRLGVEIPLRTLFDAATVAGLAQRIETLQSGATEGSVAQSTFEPPPLVPVPHEDNDLPLSFGQERLWFLDRMEPGTSSLNMGTALRLRGPLDIPALAGALNEVVRRHESLRTTFRWTEGRPVQVVAPHLAIGLPLADLSGLPEDRRGLEADRLAAEELASSFDLASGPLLRARLMRLEPGLHAFVLNVHHIVSDGWSMGILTREVSTLYAAFAEERPSPLPELPVQYPDFTLWQRSWLQGEALEAQLAYWRERLGGNPEPLDLPLDWPRPAVQTFRGGSLLLRLPESVIRPLRTLSRDEGASLFMALLAGFKLLVHRLSGQTDILVGTPIAGRRQVETEGLIGFFLNTLVLRTDLSGGSSFRDLLARVRETTFGAYAHQDIPFEALLNELQPERDLSRTPLFQVFFNMLNLPAEAVQASEVLIEPMGMPEEAPSKFDLTFYVAEAGEAVQIHLVYNADLFDRPRMEELLDQYRRVLEQVGESSEANIEAMSLRTSRSTMVLPDPTALLGEEWWGAVHELFAERARRHPDKEAVVDGEGVWTYGELDRATDRLAAHLQAAGVVTGDRVAIYAHRSAPVVWAVLGVLKAGAAFVMLDPAYPAARLIEMLRLAEPRAWIEIAAAGSPPLEVAEHLASLGLCRVSLPGGGPAGALSSFPEQGPAAVSVGPDDIAYVAFTSGSTGVPKGILGRHGPLSHFLPWQSERFGLGEADRYTLFSGLAHDPLQRDIFTPLCLGGTVCIPASEEMETPGLLARWMARQEVTVAHLTPAMAQILTETAGDGSVSVPSLRYALLVGDILTRLDVDRIRRLAPRVTCVNLYGSTETQRAVGYHVVEGEGGGGAETRVRQILPLGRGMKDVQLLVLSPAAATGGAPDLAGIGEVGEIWVRSPHLAEGYLGDEELTRDRFRVNPFTNRPGDRVYRTGDLGRYEPDGQASFVGRADQQVKVRGFRIELGEIEAALGRLPGVREAIVLARQDGADRRLVAYVVPAGQVPPDLPAELREALKSQLPAYMVPSGFVVLERLPVTPNRKVDRKALAALAVDPAEKARDFEPPRNPVERFLAGLFHQVLNLKDEVGRHDDFFELGGNSISGAILINRLQEEIGEPVRVVVLFDSSTVASLAAYLLERHPDAVERRWGGGLRPVSAERVWETDGGPIAPLSFSQERLWFLERITPGTPAYNMPGAIRLVGSLNVAALGRCLDEIVRRQGSLRTTFGTGNDGQPVQRIAPPEHRPLPLLDLSGLPGAYREPEAQRLVREESTLPFDLEAGPLLRVALLRLDEAEHVAVFTMHHIVSDGWSMGVFFREVSLLYAAFSQGEPSPLPELPLQYADYARRQRAELGDAALAEDLAWWRQTLAGVPVLELPTDRPRPPVKSARGTREPFAIPVPVVETLLAAGRGERATSYMTLLAAFQALLHRLADQDDVAVGSVIANRNRSDVEDLIGFFVNTLVMRTDCSGDPTFRELLGRVRQVALGAFRHQDAPFEKVVEAVQPERHLSTTPLFQVMFTLQNTPPPAGVELPGLSLHPVEPATVSSRFDLTLAAFEHPGGVSGTLEYDLDLFEPATAARLLRHLAVLIEGAGAAPDRRLSDLPLLTSAELEQILVEPNRTATPEIPGRFLHEVLSDQARLAPFAPALEAPGEVVTYRELEERSSRLARWLVRQGIGLEDRVGLRFKRSPDWIVALLGVWKAGAACVPLDPSYPESRLDHALADSGARLVLTQEALVQAEPQIDREIPVAPEIRPSLDNLAYVLYTSGTTGGPKGVAVSHRGLDNLARAQVAAFGLRPSDRILQFASPAFDASVSEIAMALRAGATLCLAPRESLMPGAPLAAFLEERAITAATLPPSGLANLENPDRFPDLACLVVAGEACPPALAERWAQGRRLFNAYGPTEATVCATVGGYVPGSRFLPLGEPIANTRVYLLDRRLQPVPVGVPGEICIAGVGLARGYLGRPDLTAERFVPDPFAEAGNRLYRTGDRARRLADGRVEFLGRVDRQVKVRGVRVELAEVEAALGAHPGLKEAAVALRGDALVAYFLSTGEAPAPAELRIFLAERLPEAYVPSRFVRLEALPLNPNGKVDYKALPEPSRSEVGTAPTAPRTPIEEVLAGIWAEVLGLEEVGTRQSFFELGGHSLSATRLMSRVQSAFGVDLPLRELFEAPTVTELAERVTLRRTEGSTGFGPPPLKPIPRKPGEDLELPASFSQERIWFLDRLEPGNTAFNIRSALRLRGPLDVPALAGALEEVVRRHEALRTTFRWTGERPVQVVAAQLGMDLPLLDLSGLPEAARGPEADRLSAEELASPFDLVHGPLLRARLIRFEPEHHAFLLNVHHIVSDGWSMGILTREVTELYAAFAQRRPSPLPELSVQYPDFAAWQRSWLQGEALESQLGYWRDKLAGNPEPLDLPLDRPRPAFQTFRGEGLPLSLPAGLAQALRGLSRREGASLFMTLLAAFKLVAHRLSGQADILIGTPIAGRRQVETEPLIGFFLNTLVLRTDLSGNPAFRDLLARVRETTLGAYAHQDIPFEALLNELQPDRDLSRTPFFQVAFNMLNFPAEAAQASELSIEPMAMSEAPSKYDITVYAAELGEAVHLHMVYNADLFDRARMEELLAQYLRVLEQAVERPEAGIESFSLLTARTASVLPDPAEPLGDDWHGAVHELFAARARLHPEKEAVVDDEGSWTYGELDRATDRLAARLRAAGVTTGDRVAIYAHRSAPVAWAVLGALKAGAAFVMLDPAYPAPRLVEMLRLADPRAWIEIAAAGPLAKELEDHLASTAAGGSLLARLALPGGGPMGAEPLLAAFPDQKPESVEIGPDDVAYVAFTSGSTGVPKGILGRHGPLSHFLPWQSRRFGLGEGDRYSLLSGLAHDPLQRDLFTALCLGGTVCVPAFEEIATPGRLARWMARREVTVAHLTPAMGQILAETGSGEPPSVPSLRYVLLVGDVLTRLDVDRIRRIAPRVTCVNLYGSTETQRAVAFHVVEDEGAGGEETRARQILPLGRGMQDVQLLVVNPSAADSGPALAGIGEVGEIWVRSPHLSKGYLGDEELTRDRFRINPFTGLAGDRVYRTGDLGRYQPDGEVVFVGRADQQVKIRGFRIELGEIEAALGRLPGVREAIVLARQDGTNAADIAGKRLVAYVVPDGPPASSLAAELRDALRAKLPAYMVPSAFALLERLPVTPNGKVDRRALAQVSPGPDGLDASLESTFVEPEGDLESQIAAVWREVLGLERVGVQHNFFDLGGHSLLLVRLHARLQESLGRELSLVDLFNYPSVRALAEHLGRQSAAAAPTIEAAQDRAQRQIEAARRQKELARARRGR